MTTPPSGVRDEQAALGDSLTSLQHAAARVERRTTDYGPLWNLKAKHGLRMTPLVYDCISMVFLDREGVYYKVDQTARRERGELTNQVLISNLRVYHSALRWAKLVKGDGWLTSTQVKDWWTMTAQQCAWVNQQWKEEAAHRKQPFVPYERSHVPFLRRFTPQSMDRRRAQKFFESVSFYVPLFLSTSVELKPTPSLPGARFAYGVFALMPLDNVGSQVGAVRGQLCQISEEEYDALMVAHANHSLLGMTKTEIPHITVKGIIERDVVNGGERAQRLHRRERERQRAARAKPDEGKPESTTTVVHRPQTVRRVYHFIVTGGLSFLNNACCVHSNLHPCAWKNDDDTGDGQYQVVTLKQPIGAGEELWISYSADDEMDQCPCLRCGEGHQ